jgi:hypothetical protein
VYRVVGKLIATRTGDLCYPVPIGKRYLTYFMLLSVQHLLHAITCRVTEAAAEILRHLTLRASTPATTSSSGFGSFLSPLPSQTQTQQAGLVQSQDDVSRVQALLLLQADR